MSKGDFNLTKEMILWIVRIIIVSIFMVFIIIEVSSYFNVRANIEETENQVIIYNILNCLNEDGYIDVNNFNQDRINNCLNLNENKYGLRLRLYHNSNEENFTINDKIIRREPLCNFKDNFACVSKGYYILVKDNNIYPGNLRIDLVNIR